VRKKLQGIRSFKVENMTKLTSGFGKPTFQTNPVGEFAQMELEVGYLELHLASMRI